MSLRSGRYLDVEGAVERACDDPAIRITAEERARYVPELPFDPPCE